MNKLSFKAIILGFIADTGGSMVAGVFLVGGWIAFQIAHGVPPKDFSTSERLMHALYGNPSFVIISMIIGLGFTAVGGAITGWFAPASARLLNAAVLGVIEIVLGLAMGWSLPIWYNLICAVLTVPTALFGALIVKLVKSDL